MMMFLLMLASLPAAGLIFVLGWKAGLLSTRISIDPNRSAAALREKTTRQS